MIDRRFLDVSLSVQGIANAPAENPATGTQYIVGAEPSGAFINAKTGQIARYDGTAWIFYTLKAGELEVINLATNEILVYNGTVWKPIVELNTGGGCSVVEYHVLTVEDAERQYITLENYISDKNLPSVLLSVCGIIQVPGIDYDVYGNTLSWSGKALDFIGLVAGDKIVIQYMKG